MLAWDVDGEGVEGGLVFEDGEGDLLGLDLEGAGGEISCVRIKGEGDFVGMSDFVRI